MCGIAGILGKTRNRMSSDVVKMTNALAHRGPDDFGYASACPGETVKISLGVAPPDTESMAVLGHRRLSIIDLSGSRQPLSNEDGTVCTVFNGEIYNYVELIELLVKKGHVFRNKGDTEVLVHLWEEFGKEMVNHLVGMFAFCIYDSRSGTLFLARDRFGQKPVYYFERNDNFHFASELQAFFPLDNFKRNETNGAAIAQYFRYGFIPNPETAYKDVFMLPPGHTLEIRGGIIFTSQYWKPTVTGDMDLPDYGKLEELLDESVRLRLRADVPFGSFLSGGIDSALITSSMMKYSPAPVRTFTISTGKEYFTDESGEAAETARLLGTEHNTLEVSPDFIPVAEKLAASYGQPYSDYSSILTYYVSRETRQFVKVALTGDGGDELFAGYNGYLRNTLYNSFGSLPFTIKKAAASLSRILTASNPDSQLYDSISSVFPLPLKGENIAPLFHRRWRDSAFQNDFSRSAADSRTSEIERFASYYREASSDNPIDRWLEADQRLYLCDDILVKLDIASMAVSLECRSPFLDHRFAEFANKISSASKMRNGIPKAILREIARRRNLAHITGLPKKGFSMPFGQWLRQEPIKHWIHSLIFENNGVWNTYLKEEAVEGFWKEHQSGRMNHHMRIWMIASLVLWQKALKGT